MRRSPPILFLYPHKQTKSKNSSVGFRMDLSGPATLAANTP